MGLFRRIKRPVDGHAEIVETWKRRADRSTGNCKMKLLLDVPGVAPQVVKHHEPIMTANRWPELGMRVAVTVDADHPDRVDVHWDSVFGEVRGGILGRGLEAVAVEFGVDVDLSRGVPDPDAGSGRPAADYQAQIDALNAQFAAGQITYEEMSEGVLRAIGAKR